MSNLKTRMEASLNNFKKELTGLRTGRASPNLLENVVVSAYGQTQPLKQLGFIKVSDVRTLSVQVWDKSLAPQVEKAILEANLGLNPQRDGEIVRIALPQLTQERREELVKVAHKYAEQARVGCRNVRREGMDELKAQQKNKEISEDEFKTKSNEVQKLTDEYVKKIDTLLNEKEQDILKV